jgi:large repetitive protein
MTSSMTENEFGNLVIASGPTPELASLQSTDLAAQELAIARTRMEIVFIEDDVPDLDTLVQGIGSGKEIVILDSTQDGLHQIVQALAGRSGIDAVHVIAHGAKGVADFGTLQLNGADTGAHSEDLAAIGRSMAAGGDILLYGCNIGAGEDGAGFLEQLAITTGADVAASNDRTGSAALGGDWELEVSTGQVEAKSIASSQLAALYQQALGLTSKIVGFSNDANFLANPSSTYAGASGDVIYKVGGDINYQLHIDATSTAVYVYSSPTAYLNVAGQVTWDQEKAVTLSFVGGAAVYLEFPAGH